MTSFTRTAAQVAAEAAGLEAAEAELSTDVALEDLRADGFSA